MNLTQLRYLVAIADVGSFTKAAASCHIAQPSLSQQIAKLETELGTPLFDRLGRGVVLTEAGQLLVDRARVVLSMVEETTVEVSTAGREVSGRLRVGAVATVAQYMLPPLITGFLKKYPAVDLMIHETSSEELLSLTLDATLDVAIVSRPIDDPLIHVQPLTQERYLVALPYTHPLAQRDEIQIEDLSECRFVLLQRKPEMGTVIESYCIRHGFEPRVVCRGMQLATIQAMVGAGLGISFVPEMAAHISEQSNKSHSNHIVYKPLSGDCPMRTISLITRHKKHITPAAKRFIQFLNAAK